MTATAANMVARISLRCARRRLALVIGFRVHVLLTRLAPYPETPMDVDGAVCSGERRREGGSAGMGSAISLAEVARVQASGSH
jgi:hypothetical protein